MSAEDRLKDILSSEASTILPAGDGLARIQQRIARRRRLRMVLLPAGALATTAAVAAVLVLGGGIGTQSLEQVPPATQGPTPTTEPSPVPAYDGPAIWPFTSPAEATAWTRDPASRPWAASAREVAQRFATDFLDLDGVTAHGDGNEVTLRLGADDLGTAKLVRLGADGPWTVIAVDGGDLAVTAPAAGAEVSSPTTVTGRITGLHENVRLQLVTSAGKQLGQASAPAGEEAPWQGILTWTDTSWATGAVVGITRSDRDGSLTRLVAVPVTRSDQPPVQADSFVGLIDGKVHLLDGPSGKVLRQLTYPPVGTSDSAASWSGSTLAWVRSADNGCSNTLYRKTGEDIETVVPPGASLLTSVQLSPDATQLALVQVPCGGGTGSLLINGDRVISLPAETDSRVLDVADSGAVLLLTRPGCAHCATAPEGNDRPVLRRVPAGATSLAQAQRVPNGGGGEGSPDTACTWHAAAFDGSRALAAETCAEGSRVVRINSAGQRVGVDPFLSGGARFEVLTIRSGTVLAHAFDSDVDSDGVLGTYRDGRITPFAQPAGCSAETGAGCIKQPDW